MDILCEVLPYNGQITKTGLVKPTVSVVQDNGKIFREECQHIGAIPILPCSFLVFLRYFALMVEAEGC